MMKCLCVGLLNGDLIKQLKFAKEIKDYDVNSYSTHHNPDIENNAQQMIRCDKYVLCELQLISLTTLKVHTWIMIQNKFVRQQFLIQCLKVAKFSVS